MNSKPTFVFSSSEIAIEMGRQFNRDKNNYLSSTYTCFNINDKRVSKMATMHCESENNENSETFWSR